MYRAIFDHSKDAIIYTDHGGTILKANPAAGEVFNRPPQEMTGKTLDDMASFNGFMEKKLTPFLLKRAGDKPPGVVELSLRLKNGNSRILEVSSGPVHIKKNAVPGYVFLMRDITERKRNEDFYTDCNDKFKMLFDNANDGIIYLDRDSVIRASNKRIEELFGYGMNEIIGKKFIEIPVFDPGSMSSIFDIFMDSIDGVLPPLLEFEGIHRSGKKFHLEISPTLIKDSEGIVGLVAIIRDITTRKKVVMERARLIDILEAAPDFVITYDRDGRIRYINRAARIMFGLSTGCNYHDSVLAGFREDLYLLPETGIWTGEAMVVSKEGKAVTVSQVIMSHHMGDSDETYYSTIMRDITEQKQNENHIKYLTHHLIRVQ